MTEPIPVAVVGAGNMGRNHVRVYEELDETELVEVVEPDPERAAELSQDTEAQIHDDVEGIRQATAASIAVPNEYHVNTAKSCLESGLDILVEKPLAPDPDGASAIIEAAEDADAVLQVGHIERYNPVVGALKDILSTSEPIAIEAHRLGPFNDHLTDESVVMDLMLHDLDIVTHLIDEPVESIDASGTDCRSNTCDYATSQINFSDGTIATVTASHVTHGKIRTLSVTTEESYITLDYQKQDIEIQRVGTEQNISVSEHGGYRAENVIESPYVQTQEPLRVELRHFADCVRTRSEPRVSGKDGLEAVRLARRTIDQM